MVVGLVEETVGCLEGYGAPVSVVSKNRNVTGKGESGGGGGEERKEESRGEGGPERGGVRYDASRDPRLRR